LVPADCERRISRLLEHLREQRVLLVLDNLESLLEEGEVRGHLRPGDEGYARLLRRVAETGHQSCLLLTSREKPAQLRALEGRRCCAGWRLCASRSRWRNCSGCWCPHCRMRRCWKLLMGCADARSSSGDKVQAASPCNRWCSST